jgi:hypothetical protein
MKSYWARTLLVLERVQPDRETDDARQDTNRKADLNTSRVSRSGPIMCGFGTPDHLR